MFGTQITYKGNENVRCECARLRDTFQVQDFIGGFATKGNILDVKVSTTTTGMVLGGEGEINYTVIVFYVPNIVKEDES